MHGGLVDADSASKNVLNCEAIRAVDALAIARRMSQAALRNSRHCPCDIEDVAANALLRSYDESEPITAQAIAKNVRREAWRWIARRRAERRFRRRLGFLACATESSPGNDGDDSASDAAEQIEKARYRRSFADGSQVQVATHAACAADLAALELKLPNGRLLHGEEAQKRAHFALLLEVRRQERPQQTSNALRAAHALSRDSLLLSVAGLPWQEALPALAAKGVVLSRAALRSGLRAARLRCAGKTAHDRCR